MRKNNQSGRTLIEVILAISLVAMVTTGLAKVAGSAITRFQISSTSTRLFEMRKAIKTRYMAVGDYQGMCKSTCNTEDPPVCECEIADVGRLRDDRILTGSQVVGPEGNEQIVNTYGDVFIKVGLDADGQRDAIRGAFGIPTDVNTIPENRYFSITYTNVPNMACVTFLNIDWPHSGSTGIVAMYAQRDGDDTTTLLAVRAEPPEEDDDWVSFPIPVARIADQCAETGNKITWYFY